ncbi:MAG TPA: hypothetical protein EYG74_06395 [Sulfurimonas autotrophica]|nr:hypothetical protein [Sulfurimonas autotrophica]
MSVTFSFSYWYEEFSAESYSQRSSELQLNKVKQNLLNAKNSFIAMESSLTKLSEYSATKSNREKVLGGTCDPKVGSGESFYTWIRADDSKYTKSYSEDIKGLVSQLDTEINQVSLYLETFDPTGDVVQFNRVVNDRINQINSKFFENQTLQDLKEMLTKRSGANRHHISVISKKTAGTAIKSCMDRDFTIGANKVINRLNKLKPINTLSFFDMSDTKKLFSRTTGVLMALLDLSYEIKDVSEITDPSDITYDDVSAVVAGLVIDFLILLVTIIAKEPKEDLVPIELVKRILDGRYPSEVLNSLNLFLAELDKSFLIAVPNNVDDDKKIDSVKLLMLYMQQQKLAKLHINERKANRLNKYFHKRLKESYPDSTFRVYKINKKEFNDFILQNVLAGADDV